MAKLIRNLRQRVLYQSLVFSVIMALALTAYLLSGQVVLESDKALVSLFIGVVLALLTRPRDFEAHQDGARLYFSLKPSNFPRYFDTLVGLAYATILVPIFFGAAYFVLTLLCAGSVFSLLVLRLENARNHPLLRR